MRYYGLEKLINLHDGYRRVFRIDQHRLLLLQIGMDHHLVEADCPHRGQSLEAATLVSSAGGEPLLICPRHRYGFDLLRGNLVVCTEEPCRPLRVFEAVYRGNELGVML